jgi:Short C-terminal domain/PASTA domain
MSPTTDDPTDRLRQLHELHAQGVLSDQEFETAKARVLGLQPNRPDVASSAPPTPIGSSGAASPTPPKKTSLSRTQWIFVGIGVFLILALIGALTGSSKESPPAQQPNSTQAVTQEVGIPNFVGQRLDLAKAHAADAGLNVDVVGGGAFGILEEDNWYVCSQEPSAGTTGVDHVRLIVDRQYLC